MKMLLRYFLILVFCGFASQSIAAKNDTIRIMYYNILKFNISKSKSRIAYLKTIVNYVNPDIILVNEILNKESADYILDKVLNKKDKLIFSSGTYKNGRDSDNMVFFKNHIFKLNKQIDIKTNLRDISGYRFYVKASKKDSLFFYAFAVHLKASNGNENRFKRLSQIESFIGWVNGLDAYENVIIGGDFNFYCTEEPAYLRLINNKPIQFYDLAGTVKTESWNNALYSRYHTQSTRTRAFGGGAIGGLDDRFDYIFATKNTLKRQNRMQYLKNSFYAVGNDGQHYNDSINAPPNIDISKEMADALHYFSDHLPIVADFILNFR